MKRPRQVGELVPERVAARGRIVPTAAVLLFFLAPLAWQVLTSLWAEAELTRPLPSTLTLANYAGLGGTFARAVLNSLLVAAGTTVLCLAVGASAAFAIAKLEFRGRSLLLGSALAISMFPPIATVSPENVIARPDVAMAMASALLPLCPRRISSRKRFVMKSE